MPCSSASAPAQIYIIGGYTDLLFSETTKRAWAYDPPGADGGPDCGSAGTAGSAPSP